MPAVTAQSAVSCPARCMRSATAAAPLSSPARAFDLARPTRRTVRRPTTASALGHGHPRQQQQQRGGEVAAHALRPGETAEQALERRMRESAEVEQRVTYIDSEADWQRELQQAGDNLIVLEVQSEQLCQTGYEEEAELHWKEDQKRAMEPCRGLKHTFARTARESKDVVFLSLEADTDEGSELCNKLEIDVLPTIQFWRSGQKLFEHKGVVQLEQGLGEGVLFYGDTAANNEKASTFVTDLHTKQDLEQFVEGQPEHMLTVVNVSLLSAAPCVHIFPAVLALARNFGGYAAFARLLGDETPHLLAELDIKEVPTFIFYRNGEEVGRHVGSSRGDLIGKILEQQSKAGIKPPPPPPGTGTKRPMRRGRYTKSSA